MTTGYPLADGVQAPKPAFGEYEVTADEPPDTCSVANA